MKRLPEEYFQAIGSGTGGIAAWEASMRLIADGRFGNRLPRLHLAQNLPFAPMYYAWAERRREIIPEKDMPNAKAAIAEMYSDILSNRAPPYGIKGGVYDAMVDTDGLMYGITNKEAVSAKRFFDRQEGIDILPPAAVAVAALLKAYDNGTIHENSSILLNVTGGGYERLKQDMSLYTVKPCLNVDGPDVPMDIIKGAIQDVLDL